MARSDKIVFQGRWGNPWFLKFLRKKSGFQGMRTYTLVLWRKWRLPGYDPGGEHRHWWDLPSRWFSEDEVWEPLESQRCPRVSASFWGSVIKGEGHWLRRRPSPDRKPVNCHEVLEQEGKMQAEMGVWRMPEGCPLPLGVVLLSFNFLSLMRRIIERKPCGLGATLIWVQIPLRIPGSLALGKSQKFFKPQCLHLYCGGAYLPCLLMYDLMVTWERCSTCEVPWHSIHFQALWESPGDNCTFFGCCC